MFGGTLLALAADEIVLGQFAVLDLIDPQIVGLPTASIVKAQWFRPMWRRKLRFRPSKAQ